MSYYYINPAHITIGRDAVNGYVWLYPPTITRGAAPERIYDAKPKNDLPRRYAGFADPNSKPTPEPEPVVWEGDDS